MKKRMFIFTLVLATAVGLKAQWAIDSTNTAGVNMYSAATSTSAIFSNGTEWNIFNAATGVHTYGNLTISRSMIDVVSYGDKVYFGGGKYGSFADPQYTKTVNVYNNATNSWSVLNLSNQREVGGAGAIGNKILFAGGTGRTDIAGPVNMYKTVDIFDAVTGARTKGNLSKARTNIAVGAAGNKIVFAGGWYWDMMYSMVPSNNADIYDVSTGVWSKTTLSKKRDNISSAVVGNIIIFAGGFGNMGEVTNVDLYDVSTNSWSVTYLPVAKSSMRSAVIGSNAYFAGGTGGATNDVYIYNVVTNSWNTTSMPVSLTGFSLSVINGKLYCAGGIDVAGVYHNDVQIYDPATNTWSVQYLSIARTGVAAAVVGSKGYFAGGTKAYGYPAPITTNRVDIYNAPLRSIIEETILQSLQISIYPNPANDVIHILFESETTDATVRIFDVSGNLIQQLIITDELNTIQIDSLVPGNYIVIVTDSAGNQVVKKIMKF
jgi:hypothetical protein